MPAQYVKAYVKRNKNDAADAEAICEAVVRPTMRFVPAKTAEQRPLCCTPNYLLPGGGHPHMKRRNFITLLGGAAAAWPLATAAQDPVRRIGMILPATSDDPEFQTWVEAFLQGLAQLGWTIGHNVRIDTH